jgi:hypothetical protein
MFAQRIERAANTVFALPPEVAKVRKIVETYLRADTVSSNA